MLKVSIIALDSRNVSTLSIDMGDIHLRLDVETNKAQVIQQEVMRLQAIERVCIQVAKDIGDLQQYLEQHAIPTGGTPIPPPGPMLAKL